ncbi:methyltransferase [Vibrio sp. CAIM 722]|uniref:Methyltransferase n=1 Tax=Vibrio eleionomae TaxID=2653505 RepID=A0A7X4LJP5_9VIBR|nr:methyltransferase [Vibrio eleionomae]MZI92821.1 methyltransferase [Vibrio eleionomae]
MKQKFSALDQFLTQHQLFWRFEPFFCQDKTTYPWALSHPELNEWLDALTFADLEQYQSNFVSLLQSLECWIPGISEHYFALEDSISHHDNESPLAIDTKPLSVGIPGRKLKQITALTQQISTDGIRGFPWLEWCAGKGYLGRFLANQHQGVVTSVELQQALCDDGQDFANQHHLDMTFCQGDALKPEAKRWFTHHQHVVALHACGDLHLRMLEHAVVAKSEGISFSPCCYHLTKDEFYRPLSRSARHSQLNFTRQELRIPLQETVTGGQRVKRHRQQEMTFRLGLDLWVKSVLGSDVYCSVPSIKKSVLSEGFHAFCQWACELKGWPQPSAEQAVFYEKLGAVRFEQMEKASLVQHAFRRMIEWWLIFDRALYLEDAGYHVVITEFCSRLLTPRNFLIQARLKR